jgi:hypothetical protein
MMAERAEVARLTAELTDAALDKAELSRIRPKRGDPYCHSTVEEWAAQCRQTADLRAGLAAMKQERDGLAVGIERILDLSWEISQKGHHTNYDWNADPDSLTVLESEMYAVREKYAAILTAVKARAKAEGLREAAREARSDPAGRLTAAQLDRMAEQVEGEAHA